MLFAAVHESAIGT